MAAETLAAQGVAVHLYDAMPSLGRKFLMAGKGGMNITHSESADAFVRRYGARADRIGPMLDALSPERLRAWVHALGIDTFVGSSGRVFPTDMKAAPLLRAWLHRVRESGVRIHTRHRWIGFGQSSDGWHVLRLATREGEVEVAARAVVLALGGGSWARLDPTAHGCRYWRRAAWTWRHCGRPIAGSMSSGASCSASAMRAIR